MDIGDYSILRTMSNLTEIPKSSKSRPCLLVVLRPNLTLAKGVEWPLKGFVIGEKQYHDANFGDWTQITTGAPASVFATEQLNVDTLTPNIWYRFAVKAMRHD